MDRTMRPTPPPDPAKARRHHERRGLRMSAEIRTARSVFTAMTRDLSEGGAGLDCDRPLEAGEEVTVGLFLVLDDVEADTPPLWVKGRVVWARPAQEQRHAAGVSFDVISEEQRGWLRHVLREMSAPG